MECYTASDRLRLKHVVMLVQEYMGVVKKSTISEVVGCDISNKTKYHSTPGSRGPFLAPSPLRTVRDSFPSHGSSPSRASLSQGRPGD